MAEHGRSSGQYGKNPASSGSLERRVQQLPQAAVQRLMDSAAVKPDDLVGGCPKSGWGFTKVPSSDLEFPGEFLRGIRQDRWYHCPDSLDGMAQAYGVQSQLECLRGSTLHPMPTEEQRRAVQKLRRELKKDSQHAWSTEAVMKGIDLAKAGDYSKARMFYDQALDLNPQNADALVAKGASYANQTRFFEAVRCFEEAIEINPEHANASQYLKATRQKLPAGAQGRGASGSASCSSRAAPGSQGEKASEQPVNFQEELQEAFEAAKRKQARKEKKSDKAARRAKKRRKSKGSSSHKSSKRRRHKSDAKKHKSAGSRSRSATPDGSSQSSDGSIG